LNKITKIILVNITILVVGIVFIELFFGTWFGNSNYSSLLIPRQQTNIIDSFPYKSNILGIYSRDNNGFRANQYELDEVDILILGGSTTEEREVDDKSIWTKVFEINLNKKLKVLNAGIGGQTSYGHKIMFDMWFKKLSKLSPKFIIVYLGINDALFLVENSNNKKSYEEGRKLNSSNRDTLLNLKIRDRYIQYVKNNSALHSLYLIIKGNIISNKYNFSYNQKPKIFKPYEGKSPENLINVNESSINLFKDYYNKNLQDIYYNSQEYNSELILITQIISKKHWLKDYVTKVNLLTIDFCELKKIKCINLESEFINLNENIFYDGIHTTPLGSKVIGEFIAKKFNSF